MSQTQILATTIAEIAPHPNADRLEIAKVKGLAFSTVIGKGSFAVGDRVAYFPPDIMLPGLVAETLGVKGYLRSAVIPGDTVKSNCKVSATRLRGSSSYGFVWAPKGGWDAWFPEADGIDITHYFGGMKYVPTIKIDAKHGDSLPEVPGFPRYTSIEHFQRYPDAIPEGTAVRITEKLHGTNSRVGFAMNPQTQVFEWVAGSHNTRRAQYNEAGHETFYWKALTEQVRSMIDFLILDREPGSGVVVYGELFGPGIQDMDYGLKEYELRVFDIAVDGNFLDWVMLQAVTSAHGVPLVPLTYIGAFSAKEVEDATDGNSQISEPGNIKSSYKGREGCVITPLVEGFSDVLNGRQILKSVSADYHARKGAKDED